MYARSDGVTVNPLPTGPDRGTGHVGRARAGDHVGRDQTEQWPPHTRWS